MLFKMLGIQRAWEMQASGMPKPRQIFVTKSRVLATKVQEYFTKLLESLALAGYSLEELKRMQARNTESGLVDADDEDQTDIPRRYSALEENHFPLFVTFDKVVFYLKRRFLRLTLLVPAREDDCRRCFRWRRPRSTTLCKIFHQQR